MQPRARSRRRRKLKVDILKILIAEVGKGLARSIGGDALRVCWRDHHEVAKKRKSKKRTEYHGAQSVAQIIVTLTPRPRSSRDRTLCYEAATPCGRSISSNSRVSASTTSACAPEGG